MRSEREGALATPQQQHFAMLLTNEAIAAESQGETTILRWTGSAWEETETIRTLSNPSPDVEIPQGVRLMAMLFGTQWLPIAVYSCG